MQETRVRYLVQEDPTRCEATKPMHHNYWPCAREPGSHTYWRLCTREPVLHSKRSRRNEKPCTAMKRSPCSLQDPAQPKIHKTLKKKNTALYWKTMASRTFTARKKSMPGFKDFKGRYTLLWGDNVSGELKLMPMLIYHFQSPRALKN